MSIINDALKKIQLGQPSKPDEKTTPAESTPPSSGQLFSMPAKTQTHDEELPMEHISSAPNKIKSIFALLCAVAIFIGAFWFFFKQIDTYFPQLKKSIKSSYYKLIHKKELPAFKTKDPKDIIPLAKITVPTNPAASSSLTVNSNLVKPETPVTLNIHGIMSNGSSNLVLIDDQVYQEGDEVDGIKIVKITLNSITVINNGIEQTIHVKN